MRLTQKGQVTVPKSLRDQYGMKQGTEVAFKAVSEGVLIYPQATSRAKRMARSIEKVRGCADAGLSTDEIMDLTRD